MQRPQRRWRPSRRPSWWSIILVVLPLLIGCEMPQDPEGTFVRVRGGTIRAGITERSPWTRFEGEREAGIEVELLGRFAKDLDAEIEWTRGSESELLESLHRGNLDVVIGGLTDSTPWASRVGLTQPYVTIPGEQRDDKHVFAVRAGENRWLLALDEFLQGQREEVRQMLQADPVR